MHSLGMAQKKLFWGSTFSQMGCSPQSAVQVLHGYKDKITRHHTPAKNPDKKSESYFITIFGPNILT